MKTIESELEVVKEKAKIDRERILQSIKDKKKAIANNQIIRK